jgi:hypothetical protein
VGSLLGLHEVHIDPLDSHSRVLVFSLSEVVEIPESVNLILILILLLLELVNFIGEVIHFLPKLVSVVGLVG